MNEIYFVRTMLTTIKKMILGFFYSLDLVSNFQDMYIK
jgi:hypothetical protein